MRLKMLQKRMAKLEARKDELSKRALASEDAAEVRSLTEQIENIVSDLEDIKDEIAVLEDEQRQNDNDAKASEADESRSQAINADIVAGFGQTVASTQTENRSSDPYSSLEYREAFKAYVQKGVSIPANLLQKRDNVPTTTQDLGAVVPTTVMDEIIKNLPGVYGQLLRKVRRTSLPGGVRLNISDLSGNFRWINETTVSPRQKAGTTSYIEFGYNIGEIRIAETMLASIVSLGVFESEIADLIAEAYAEAMDDAIVNGSGDGAPLGMLNDSRVPADHRIEMTAADFANWTAWRKKFFAKLPMKKRAGEFIMPLSTVETYLHTMADSNNQPIFHQATGLEVADADRATDGRFFGREMTYVEPDIIPDFDTAQAGDVVGIFWTPKDYIVNDNLGFGIRRYYDNETSQFVNVGTVVTDGKLGDVSGVYFIVKK